MCDATPDTITLHEQHYEDVRSTGADVLIKVSETSVGGRSSQRVAALRERLAARGIAAGEILLEAVDLTPWAWIAIPFVFIAPVVTLVGTGSLRAGLVAGAAFVVAYLALRAAKLGTVTATLKVRCPEAERVGVVIDAACSFGAEIAAVSWRYDLRDALPADWMVACVERANARAARMAAALGVRILGVHTLQEEQTLPRAAYSAPGALKVEVARSKGRLGSVSESLGAAPANTERAGSRVTIVYRVGDYRAEH
jgi:hypothetical protein